VHETATSGQDDGNDFAALPLAFLHSLPQIVTAVEVEGWRLTRT
jgi:hypothetical protein